MQTVPVDLFATKGMEYVLVIGYLLLLVALRRVIWPRKAPGDALTESRRAARPRFAVPEGLYFHQGHGWAALDGSGVMRVGMDEFAEKLLGRAERVMLPPIGARLAEGEAGWRVEVADGGVIPVLSPVDGEVVEINPAVLLSPALVNSEPYERGWLMKVRVPSASAARHNLLSGRLARTWMNQISEKLSAIDIANEDVVLTDGAFGEIGYARALAPDDWDRVAREFLLVGDSTAEEPTTHTL